MRSPEANSLDLNNVPQDYYTRDASAADTSSPGGGYSKKKSGGGGARAEKEEAGKVYECRFCSLKFCKSQALGGHMNRHRQERETETLNKARQLVFSNDLAPPPHIGYVSSGQAGVPYHQGSNINITNDTSSLPFRSVYPTTSRMFSTIPPPPPPPMVSYPSAVPPPNNYYVTGAGSYFTCIGAPVSHGGGGGGGGRGGDQGEGRNWGRS